MKVAVVSPSAPSTHTEERLSRFENGLVTLRELGLEVEVMTHAKDNLSYVSALAEDRLSDLQTAYKDPSVEVVICANGGWNSSHLLGVIDWELIRNNPKPLCGFSDTAILLNAIYKMTGVVQLHGPMVTWGFSENDKVTNRSFLNVLNGESQEMPTAEFGKFIQGSNLKGTLIGGNLVSLSTLIGTEYEPEWGNKVLLWEETEEATYRLDRVLTHFKNTGIWDKISGMIIGRLDDIEEGFAGRNFDAWNLIENHFKDCNFPIFKTELFGHGIGANMTFPIGGTIEIDGERVVIK